MEKINMSYEITNILDNAFMKLLKMFNKKDVGNRIDLNDVVQYELNCYNIDDRGIALYNPSVNHLNDVVWEMEESIGDYVECWGKEKVNQRIKRNFFVWLDISFLEDWRKEWDYENQPLTIESIKEFKTLVKNEYIKWLDTQQLMLCYGCNKKIKVIESNNGYPRYDGRVCKSCNHNVLISRLEMLKK